MENKQSTKEKRLQEKAFVKDVMAGNAPQEWTDMYNKLRDKIIEKLKNGGCRKFNVYEEVEPSYFNACSARHLAYKSDAALMIKYFTKKFRSENFKVKKCSLSNFPEYYVTQEDIERQKREQLRAEEEAERMAEEENERAWQRYRDELSNGGYASLPPLYVKGMGRSRARKVPVRPTGVKPHYNWVVKVKV